MKKYIRFVRSLLIQAIVWITCGVIRIVPASPLYLFTRLLGGGFFYAAHKIRTLSLLNIARALGAHYSDRRRRDIARQSCISMGYAVVDALRYGQLPEADGRRLIRLEGFEHILDIRKRGGGVIAVTAHLGCFPLLGYRLALESIPVNFVARHSRDRGIEQIGLQYARDLRLRIIFSRPLRQSVQECRAALSRNEVIIVALDQIFGKKGKRVVFFGRPAMVSAGLLGMGVKRKSPILPMFTVRQPDHSYRCIVEPPLFWNANLSEAEQEQQMAQSIVTIIEKYIREYPGQWMSWIHKRWGPVPGKMDPTRKPALDSVS